MEAVTSSLLSRHFPVLLRHRTSIVAELPFNHRARSSHGHGRSSLQPKANAEKQDQREEDEEDDDEEEMELVSKVSSAYNEIMIIDTPTSRMLILDSSYNVHSILYKDKKKWTDSTWDEFASLPPIVPKGWWNCCSYDARFMAGTSDRRLGDRSNFD